MTDQTAEADYAPAWRPDPGDSIKGTVVSTVLGPDFGYGPYPIMTLETAEGEQAVHAMHQILRTELAQRRPRHGDEVEITYLGTRKPKSGTGNSFHVYRVRGGQEPEFDWASELPEDQRPSGGAAEEIPIAPSQLPGTAARERQQAAQQQTAQAAEETFGSAPPF